MKKIIVCLLLFINVYVVNAFAIPEFSIELITTTDPYKVEPLLEGVSSNSSDGYWFDFQGKRYVVGKSMNKYGMPIVWNENLPFDQYICAGNYYMVRSADFDNTWDRKGIKGYYSSPVQFYDENYNLVAEHTFDKKIVSSLGYYNGTYYCGLFGEEKLRKSTDMINWEVTDEELPRQTESGMTYTEHSVSFDQTSPLIPVAYEDQGERELVSTFGEWLLFRDKEKETKDEAYYLSNDNIYFVKIELPYCTINHDGRKHLDQYGNLDGFIYQENCINHLHKGDINACDIRCIYEYDEKIVIDLYNSNYYKRLTVPKEEIYAELERQKEAPYIQLNGSILGFEEPPVIEDDRMLVPMRFVFEQMGAEVEWDQDTQTATVLQENDAVAFQINNRSATVNGQAQTMDVPARLINGKTMIPIRFLSENLGYTVEWDEETNMAIITE